MALEKTLESPLDCKEIKPVNPKRINPEYSLEGLLLKLQYFGHLRQRANSLEKTLMLGKIEGRRRGMTGWDGHWLNGHDFEQTPGDSEEPGSLACSSPWGHKESDTTERLNNNNLWETYLTSLNLSLLHDEMETKNSHFTGIRRMKWNEIIYIS